MKSCFSTYLDACKDLHLTHETVACLSRGFYIRQHKHPSWNCLSCSLGSSATSNQHYHTTSKKADHKSSLLTDSAGFLHSKQHRKGKNESTICVHGRPHFRSQPINIIIKVIQRINKHILCAVASPPPWFPIFFFSFPYFYPARRAGQK